MDIEKALKTVGINKGNADKVAKASERQPSDEMLQGREIGRGTDKDIEKPLKSFALGKGNGEDEAEGLELMSSDEPQPDDDIEEGGEMDMDRPLKSFRSSEGSVNKMASPRERVSSSELLPSHQSEGVPEKAVFRSEQHKQWPMDTFTFLILNNVPFAEASVVKYVTRWREQGGVEELRKARQMVDMIIEMELNRSMYTPEKGRL
jgi:hypothetical protein